MTHIQYPMGRLAVGFNTEDSWGRENDNVADDDDDDYDVYDADHDDVGEVGQGQNPVPPVNADAITGSVPVSCRCI